MYMWTVYMAISQICSFKNSGSTVNDKHSGTAILLSDYISFLASHRDTVSKYFPISALSHMGFTY